MTEVIAYKVPSCPVTSAVHDKEKDEIYITFEDGTEFRQWHERDCCEIVEVADITGDLNDLVGYPLLIAEEVTEDIDTKSDDSRTEIEVEAYTFVKFAGIKGSVTIRWYGASNGYYSIQPATTIKTAAQREAERIEKEREQKEWEEWEKQNAALKAAIDEEKRRKVWEAWEKKIARRASITK